MNKELNVDEILKLLKKLPTSASREQVCDLIVNVIRVYGMEDDFPIMAVRVIKVLDRIDYFDDMTIH